MKVLKKVLLLIDSLSQENKYDIHLDKEKSDHKAGF